MPVVCTRPLSESELMVALTSVATETDSVDAGAVRRMNTGHVPGACFRHT